VPPFPATASAEGRQFNGAPFPASATAEGAQLNVPPFPATASAEGHLFNGAPSLWERVGVRVSPLVLSLSASHAYNIVI